MKLRVLIADDEGLCRARLRQLLEAEASTEIVAECETGREALKAARELQPDVMFLDVKMPELDGFGVLRGLEGAKLPVIIFVTAYDRFALRGFEVNAADYLLKPFDRTRFQMAMQRVRERLEPSKRVQDTEPLSAALANFEARLKPLERITIKSQGRITIINTVEIDWVSAADNYVELRVGTSRHLLRSTIALLANQLPPHRFARISRSLLVNLDRVKEIRPKSHGDFHIVLRSGERLTGSRIYRENLAPLLGKPR